MSSRHGPRAYHRQASAPAALLRASKSASKKRAAAHAAAAAAAGDAADPSTGPGGAAPVAVAAVGAAAAAAAADAAEAPELDPKRPDSPLPPPDAAPASSFPIETRATCERLVGSAAAAVRTLRKDPVPAVIQHGYHQHPLHMHRVQTAGEFVCDICACSISADMQAERVMYDRSCKDDPDPHSTTSLAYLCIADCCRVTKSSGHPGGVGNYIFGLCYHCARYDIGGLEFGTSPAQPRRLWALLAPAPPLMSLTAPLPPCRLFVCCPSAAEHDVSLRAPGAPAPLAPAPLVAFDAAAAARLTAAGLAPVSSAAPRHELYRVIPSRHTHAQGLAHTCHVCKLTSLYDDGDSTYYSCYQHPDCRLPTTDLSLPSSCTRGFTICYMCFHERDYGQRTRPTFGPRDAAGALKIPAGDLLPNTGVPFASRSVCEEAARTANRDINPAGYREANGEDYDSDSWQQNLGDDRQFRRANSKINDPRSSPAVQAQGAAERKQLLSELSHEQRVELQFPFLLYQHLKDIEAQGVYHAPPSMSRSYDLRAFPHAYLTYDPSLLALDVPIRRPLKLWLGSSQLFVSEYGAYTGYECDVVYLLLNDDWDQKSSIHWSRANNKTRSHYGGGVHHVDALTSTRSQSASTRAARISRLVPAVY